MVGRNLGGAGGLVPDRFAGFERDGTRVSQATNAAHRAEVVVERAVLLHQDDDMLHILDGTLLACRGNRQSALDAGRKHRERGGRARRTDRGLEETATIISGMLVHSVTGSCGLLAAVPGNAKNHPGTPHLLCS